MDASGGRAARTRLGMALRAAKDCHADGARAALLLRAAAACRLGERFSVWLSKILWHICLARRV